MQEEASREFTRIFNSGYRRLTRLLYRVTGDSPSAEEIASEVFWRLHAKPPGASSNLEGWLYRTGVRLALDHVKKERRRARYEALGAVFGFAAGADHALELAEERRRLRQTLAALKADQVALIVMRADGFTYAELAAQLHLNPASVGTLLSRAQEAFRKEYVKRYGQLRKS